MIIVENLFKSFKIPSKKEGLIGDIKGLFTSKFILKKALNGVSFCIPEGQMVGLIGPNGSGKSTLIKILCGILVPDSGKVLCLDYIPYKAYKRKKYTQNIGVVFGQRSHLLWDLSVYQTYLLLKKIYRIDTFSFKKTLEELTELLEIKRLLSQPARTLSLGEKLRCDLAASLLHNPKLLFLDEATFGLDIISKSKIKNFIKEWNKKNNSTVILTTHDLSDIQDICERIIIINEGKLVFDGKTNTIVEKFSNFRRLIINFSHDNINIKKIYKAFSCNKDILVKDLEIGKEDNNSYFIKFSQTHNSVVSLINTLLDNFFISDIKIKEPSIETIIRQIFEKGL